jgi:hypothetical protein
MTRSDRRASLRRCRTRRSGSNSTSARVLRSPRSNSTLATTRPTARAWGMDSPSISRSMCPMTARPGRWWVCDAEVASRSQREVLALLHWALTPGSPRRAASTHSARPWTSGTSKARARRSPSPSRNCGRRRAVMKLFPQAGAEEASMALRAAALRACNPGDARCGDCWHWEDSGWLGSGRWSCPMRPPGRGTPVSASGNAARPSEAWGLRGTGSRRVSDPAAPRVTGRAAQPSPRRRQAPSAPWR